MFHTDNHYWMDKIALWCLFHNLHKQNTPAKRQFPFRCVDPKIIENIHDIVYHRIQWCLNGGESSGFEINNWHLREPAGKLFVHFVQTLKKAKASRVRASGKERFWQLPATRRTVDLLLFLTSWLIKCRWGEKERTTRRIVTRTEFPSKMKASRWWWREKYPRRKPERQRENQRKREEKPKTDCWIRKQIFAGYHRSFARFIFFTREDDTPHVVRSLSLSSSRLLYRTANNLILSHHHHHHRQ